MSTTIDNLSPVAGFNFDGEAELFSNYTRRTGKKPVKYRRFAQAAEAVRFAVEDLPSEQFISVQLEVEERRYDSRAIRRLYESPDYPMKRRAA